MKIERINYGEEGYPYTLYNIQNPPKELYCIGNCSLLHSYGLAVVGSRKCTEYGKTAAISIGRRLGENHVTVISGMARGIDTHAHRGCLEVGGRTIAVLGCGIDMCYPVQNRRLKEEIEATGLVVSEYPPGYPASTYTFPQRNRIISGLSQGVVVVEAGLSSGSLITAELGAGQGKEVWAVPGNITSHYSFGCNKLLRDGARAISVIDDLLNDGGITPSVGEEVYDNMGEDEKKVFDVINSGGEVTVEEIYHKTNIKPSVINGIITILEMKGIIFSSFGKIFIAKF